MKIQDLHEVAILGDGVARAITVEIVYDWDELFTFLVVCITFLIVPEGVGNVHPDTYLYL